MSKKQYLTEREGQMAFFDNFRINYKDNEVLIDNTDGLWNGNLFEFKLNISDLNKVLFQAIKYLSHMRVKGESVPANILLVSLNTTTLYLYHAQDYFDDIHKIYVGAASKDNEGFTASDYIAKYDYSDMVDTLAIQKLLKEDNFMPIQLDENCIVGWAERYYRELPTASKGDFLGDNTGQISVVGEIREPKHFKGLILPYEKETNEKFKYLMDKLNDKLKKKSLGAFYSPLIYCEHAKTLLTLAIDRVPKGNDYVIIDRCAGTGNLEAVLSEDVLSHCVLSTYEYYEYKVLVERLGEKVRAIIPPTEANVEYSNGCVMNADAMSEEYINNPILQHYINDDNCTIIMYENPPYRDEIGSNADKEKTSKVKKTFVQEEMKKILHDLPNSNISTIRDLSNNFIWSAYKYYLRKPSDSYIVFSPIEYWKYLGLSEKKFLKGFLFNRKFFHASESAIGCILWSNIEDTVCEEISLQAFNIESEHLKDENKTIVIKKAKTGFLPLYDKRTFKDDIPNAIYCERSGYPTTNRKCDGKSYWNTNIIGYLVATGCNIDVKHLTLTRSTIYNIRGFYLRRDNYIYKLPVFAAKSFAEEQWYDKDVYFTTSDGGDRYTHDKDFLKSCLIYTCLSNQNKCLSFHGSDGRDYQNELCFDKNALAKSDLSKMTLDDEENSLMKLWYKILEEAKATDNYDSHWNYGVYQITKELNTYTEIGSGSKKQRVYDYPELNGDLTSLRTKLKDYYKSHITEKMFEYELIK